MPTPSLFPLFYPSGDGGGGTVVVAGIMEIEIEQSAIEISLEDRFEMELADSDMTIEVLDEITFEIPDNQISIEIKD